MRTIFTFGITLSLLFLGSCVNRDGQPQLPTCGTRVLSGYTDRASYFPGETMEFFLDTDTTTACGLQIYDWAGKAAFRVNIQLERQNPPSMPEPWHDGFNFNLSGRVMIPGNLKSGIYSIEKQVRFVVKNHDAPDVTVVYPTNTINAYNNAGGKSLYRNNSNDSIPTDAVSFMRPILDPGQQWYVDGGLSFLHNLTSVRLGYIADADLEELSSIQGRVIMLIGHNEYWTRQARKNFDQFVDGGGHAIVLSGNTMWWQVRYNAAKDAMICYKTMLQDPEPNPLLITSYWSDPKLQYPILNSIGADFGHGGYGLQLDNGWDGFRIVNPDSPLLEGISFKKGDTLHLPTGEYDGAPVSGFDADGYPVLLNDQNFEKLQLIGFDRGSRNQQETIGTFIVLKKTKTSGVVVNMGSNSWCSSYAMENHKSGQKIKRITQNAITKLLSGANVF